MAIRNLSKVLGVIFVLLIKIKVIFLDIGFLSI